MLRQMPARPEDDAFLFELYADTRRLELASWGWDEAMQRSFLHMQWNAQRHSYLQIYPNAKQYVVCSGEAPVGRIIVSRSDREIRLIDLSILTLFRNRGIGTKLLLRLQNEAASASLPLRLSVLRTNPAKSLYVRLGFRMAGENGIYDYMEWGETDQVEPSNK